MVKSIHVGSYERSKVGKESDCSGEARAPGIGVGSMVGWDMK